MIFDFYKGKRVLITGHTGFKGSWLCKILLEAGANVIGYALEAPTNPSLFHISKIEQYIDSTIGDIRDFNNLYKVFKNKKPEIVIHLAAQPLVRTSYQIPRDTYEVNVMGTVNVCECIRQTSYVRSFLNVTTDKVYKNREWEWGYREEDELNGYDPYSNSKSCSELITNSYIESFFKNMQIAVSTARAGNVIGGGDFAKNRIIPDCIRAVVENKNVVIRNPNSVRPYQHVLEPLSVYLMIAKKQMQCKQFSGCYNVGPDEYDCITTEKLVELFCNSWGNSLTWDVDLVKGPHEANFLKLDCSKVKNTFSWKPKWSISDAINKTVEWSKVYFEGGDISSCMCKQIKEFFKEVE